MGAGKTVTKYFLLGFVGALFLQVITSAQQKPLARTFSIVGEERYEVAISLQAQTQGLSTETVASKTYVMPIVREAEVRMKWRATRRIVSLQPDRSAQFEETTYTGPCQQIQQPPEREDAKLQSSLADLCSSMARPTSLRYIEDAKGSLREVGAAEWPLNLGEDGPPLLGLWLRRAVRPNVVFPRLKFEAGAKATQEFRPSDKLFRNAQGSESTEWLAEESDQPSASLHVVQQLSWDAATAVSTTENAEAKAGAGAVPRHESFFADSITTISLLDGGLLRAKRSASRATGHKLEPVAGLPGAPEFSSKLTISVSIERIP